MSKVNRKIDKCMYNRIKKFNTCETIFSNQNGVDIKSKCFGQPNLKRNKGIVTEKQQNKLRNHDPRMNQTHETSKRKKLKDELRKYKTRRNTIK